ncbi:MAG: leucine-rich repeat protein [Bacteroidaceae bacterium]|nr:leucine-rich repeat protein [Bacteroidaceae bacterium]
MMLAVSASIYANAYDFYADSNGQRIFYNITGTNTCEVTNNGEQTYTDDVEIPATVKYGSTTYTVTGIKTFAFNYCPRLSSVTIPSTVTSIGDYAFFDCTSLKSVTSYIINVFQTGDDIFYGSDNVTLYVPKGKKSQYQNTDSWNYAKTIQELPYSFKLESSYNDVIIYYTITGTNTCEVTSAVDKNNFSSADTDDTYTGEVYIPSVANGYRVTGIGSKAFMCCKNLTDVSIPSSVKSIGSYAFYYCTSLDNMTIPNSVTSIGDRAFQYCQKLSSLTIGNSVATIGTYAFGYCRKLTSVTIPNSISTIDTYTFYECSGLTSINIPNSISKIGNYAFYGCKGMTSVMIPNSVTNIGNYTFAGCTGLTSVTIPSSVTTIGGNAFYGCSGLTSVVSCITNVFQTGSNAFYGCSNATLYVLKGKKSQYQSKADWNRITNIQEAPFDFCAANDDGVTIYYNIVNEAKKTCEVSCGIDKSEFDPGGFATDYAGVVNIPSSANGYTVIGIGEDAFQGCGNLTSVTIPNSVTYIGSRAFYGYCGITSLEIPNSVTRIEGGAFAYNGILKSVTIPNSVTYIGNGAFAVCEGLTSITIPNYVTYIGDQAFYSCGSLTSVTIPSSVTYIGEKAFYMCWLTSITSEIRNVFETGDDAFATCEDATLYVPRDMTSQYQSKADWNRITHIEELDYDFSAPNDDGVTIYYRIMETDKCYVTRKNSSPDESDFYAGVVNIPSSANGYTVTGINDHAFTNCVNLTSVTIPSSVNSIGGYAFSGCTSLSSVISEIRSVTTGYDIFYGCGNITLYVPKGTKGEYQNTPDWNTVTNIQELPYSFKLKSEYNDVMIYYSIIDESNKTCEVTSAIKKTTYGSSNTDDTYTGDVFIPSHANGYRVTGIGDYAFRCCKNLNFVSIPNTVTSIGSNAFQYCTGLTSVTMPKYIKSIGDYSFWGCKGLNSITIPNSVTSIGNFAFRNCTGLNSVTSEITNVFETGASAFFGCENATLYVPIGTKSQYQSKADWNRFTTIVEKSGIIGDINNDNVANISDVVTLVNYILSPESSSSVDVSAYDVDGNGTINISDVVALVNIILQNN